MSGTPGTSGSRKGTTLGTIFVSVLTVAGVALSGLIDSPAKGVALVVTGLAFAALVARFLTIWNRHVDLHLIVLLVVFLVPLGWLLALLIPSSNVDQRTLGNGERAQLQERIADLERENAALQSQIGSMGTTATTSSTPGDESTTTTTPKTASTRSDGNSDYSLTLRYEWGADLDIGESVRPYDAEGSDIYNDGTITGRYNRLIAFSRKPSREECRAAIQQESGDWYHDFSDVTEGTHFCLLTDKERIAVLRLSRIGHDAQTSREYAVLSVSLLK